MRAVYNFPQMEGVHLNKETRFGREFCQILHDKALDLPFLNINNLCSLIIVMIVKAPSHLELGSTC